jgi:hypothetical protein
MDTELTYKYKDGLHDDIKEGHLTLDKSVYKNYAGVYDTYYEDGLDNLARRLWWCHLRATGDYQCKQFLKDIFDFSKNEDLKKTYEWLIKQELVEIIFECN